MFTDCDISEMCECNTKEIVCFDITVKTYISGKRYVYQKHIEYIASDVKFQSDSTIKILLLL